MCMKSLSEYLSDSLTDIRLDEALGDLKSAFEAAFIATNKWASEANISASGSTIDIKVSQNTDVAFTQKMATVCKKFKVSTINVSGVRTFHLENATGIEFNVEAESVLFGGHWRTKSAIKDCVVNCDEVRIEEDEGGKKIASGTKINTKVALIAADSRTWSGVSVKADKVIVPFMKFTPSAMNDYNQGKFDFAKDFDYNALKPKKKSNWSPTDMFGSLSVDAKVIVLQNSVSDYLWSSLGLKLKADPSKPKYYMTKFVSGGKDFGSYGIVFDQIPNDSNSTIDAYVDKL